MKTVDLINCKIFFEYLFGSMVLLGTFYKVGKGTLPAQVRPRAVETNVHNLQSCCNKSHSISFKADFVRKPLIMLLFDKVN